jgi:hypothetical protein
MPAIFFWCWGDSISEPVGQINELSDADQRPTKPATSGTLHEQGLFA